jgi:NAD(P)-dependent dehydrogenase (short-subunit alcohol dehydrogenase family)
MLRLCSDNNNNLVAGMLRHRAVVVANKGKPPASTDDPEMRGLLKRRSVTQPDKDHPKQQIGRTCTCGCCLRSTCLCFLFLLLLPLLLLIVIANDEIMSDAHIAEWSSDRTLVITGANSVVTSGVIEHLLRANTAHQLILVCRHVERCHETVQQAQDNILVEEEQQQHENEIGEERHYPSSRNYTKTRVSIVAMDLTSFDSIRACAQEIQQLLLKADNNHNNNQQTAPPDQPQHLLTLVWNAHDPIHDPIRTNALGHLYLTHLLYAHVERIVMAVSIVGGPSWHVAVDDTWNWTNQVQQQWPTWLEPMVHYGTSKRALLLIGHHLWHVHNLQVVVTQAGLTCEKPDACAAVSMTPRIGSKSHLRAMLDPALHGGEYLGHAYILWGHTILAGTLDDSIYHMNLDPHQGEALWKWSLHQLNISDNDAFGQGRQPLARP